MNNIWNNYRSTIILLAGLTLGGFCGAYLPDIADSIKPVGQIFLNILFILVVPLVFFSVSMAFCRLLSGGGLASMVKRMLMAFALLWLTGGILGYAGVIVAPPAGSGAELFSGQSLAQDSKPWGEALTGALSVSDFPLLFSKFSLLPLILFSALLGMGVSLSGEKGRPFSDFLQSGGEVTIKTMEVLMKAAPLGLGCYFASTVASVGAHLLGGYLRIFLLYLALSLIAVFVIFPTIIRLFKCKAFVKDWWKYILPPSLTAIATASSSAALPGNIKAAKEMGIRNDVAETVIPIGTNLLKTGSVIAAVLKIAFLMSLCGHSIVGIDGCLMVVGVAILSAVVTGAVAGGSVTGELLICSLLGVDPQMVGLIMIIGTIVDIPSTLVNSQSSVIAAIISDKKK